MTVQEEQTQIKVVYASNIGFHAIDMATGSCIDLYIPRLQSVNSKFKYEIAIIFKLCFATLPIRNKIHVTIISAG